MLQDSRMAILAACSWSADITKNKLYLVYDSYVTKYLKTDFSLFVIVFHEVSLKIKIIKIYSNKEVLMFEE